MPAGAVVGVGGHGTAGEFTDFFGAAAAEPVGIREGHEGTGVAGLFLDDLFVDRPGDFRHRAIGLRRDGEGVGTIARGHAGQPPLEDAHVPTISILLHGSAKLGRSADAGVLGVEVVAGLGREHHGRENYTCRAVGCARAVSSPHSWVSGSIWAASRSAHRRFGAAPGSIWWARLHSATEPSTSVRDPPVARLGNRRALGA